MVPLQGGCDVEILEGIRCCCKEEGRTGVLELEREEVWVYEESVVSEGRKKALKRKIL